MKSRYLFPLLLLLSCSGTQHLSAQPAPLPPTPTPVVPPAPKPPAPPKPAPKVLPVAKVQMPTLVQPGQLFAITTRGSVGTGRTAIFRPELPADATVLEMADKRTKDDAFMVTLPKGASGSYVFVFVVTQNGVAEPAVEAVPFVVGKPTPEPEPPTPGPEPKPPGPTPGPAPIPEAGFRALIIYESGDATKLPPSQQNILYGKAVREYLSSKCATEADGTKAYRIYDQNVDASAESKVWQDAMKRPRASVPWLIASNGKTGFEGPLPATVDDFMKVIKPIAEAQ